MVSIYSLQRLMDRYWSNQNELSMVLVHIEKAYNKVPREILWWVYKALFLWLPKYLSLLPQ